MAFLNLGTAFGRLFIRVASDGLRRIEIMSVLTAGLQLVLLRHLACINLIWRHGPLSLRKRYRFRGLLGGKCNSADVSVCYITLTFCCFQTMGPLCAEVADLKEVPSLLSLSCLAFVLPTACTYEH
jgi:hypothetical protein